MNEPVRDWEELLARHRLSSLFELVEESLLEEVEEYRARWCTEAQLAEHKAQGVELDGSISLYPSTVRAGRWGASLGDLAGDDDCHSPREALYRLSRRLRDEATALTRAADACEGLPPYFDCEVERLRDLLEEARSETREAEQERSCIEGDLEELRAELRGSQLHQDRSTLERLAQQIHPDVAYELARLVEVHGVSVASVLHSRGTHHA